MLTDNTAFFQIDLFAHCEHDPDTDGSDTQSSDLDQAAEDKLTKG